MALQIRPQQLAKQNPFPSSESQMPESIATLISALSFSESAPFMVNIQMNPWKTPVTPVLHWFMFAKFPHQNGHFYCGKNTDQKPQFFRRQIKSCSPHRARHPPSSDTSGRRSVSPYLDRRRQGRGDVIRRELRWFRRSKPEGRNQLSGLSSDAQAETRNPQTKTRNRHSDLSLDVQAETRNPKLTLIFHTGHKTRNMKIPRWALTSGKTKD